MRGSHDGVMRARKISEIVAMRGQKITPLRMRHVPTQIFHVRRSIMLRV
jgi:hypothetical protein